MTTSSLILPRWPPSSQIIEPGTAKKLNIPYISIFHAAPLFFSGLGSKSVGVHGFPCHFLFPLREDLSESKLFPIMISKSAVIEPLPMLPYSPSLPFSSLSILSPFSSLSPFDLSGWGSWWGWSGWSRSFFCFCSFLSFLSFFIHFPSDPSGRQYTRRWRPPDGERFWHLWDGAPLSALPYLSSLPYWSSFASSFPWPRFRGLWDDVPLSCLSYLSSATSSFSFPWPRNDTQDTGTVGRMGIELWAPPLLSYSVTTHSLHFFDIHWCCRRANSPDAIHCQQIGHCCWCWVVLGRSPSDPSGPLGSLELSVFFLIFLWAGDSTTACGRLPWSRSCPASCSQFSAFLALLDCLGGGGGDLEGTLLGAPSIITVPCGGMSGMGVGPVSRLPLASTSSLLLVESSESDLLLLEIMESFTNFWNCFCLPYPSLTSIYLNYLTQYNTYNYA